MMASVWVSVITALAALIGVIVGQAWQAQREQRRWKWERELDAEHREEQRQRDREMWAREDRNRFTDQKRQVYVDYQTCAYRISTFLVETSQLLSEEQSASNQDRRDCSVVLDDLEFTGQFTQKYDDLKVIRNHIRLMGPPQVVAAVTRIDEVLIPAKEVFYEADLRKVRDLWVALRTARIELFDSMRKDLDPESALLSDGPIAQFISHDDAERWPV